MTVCNPTLGRTVHYVDINGKCVAAVVQATENLVDPGVALHFVGGAMGSTLTAVEDDGRAPGTWHRIPN